MLVSGATDNSTTQTELLATMGRHRTIQNIEQRYRYFVQDYKNTDVKEVLSFANKFWTSQKYFTKIRGQYIEKISSLYDASISVIKKQNPEKEINDWVKKQTKGKIDKIIGKSSIFGKGKKPSYILYICIRVFTVVTDPAEPVIFR